MKMCKNLSAGYDESRAGVKYFEKYSNTLQYISVMNDYKYITCTITGPVEM